MATLRKIRRLPNREAVSVYRELAYDHSSWHMKYYNPAQRKRIKKAKKLAKRNKIFNNR